MMYVQGVYQEPWPAKYRLPDKQQTLFMKY